MSRALAASKVQDALRALDCAISNLEGARAVLFPDTDAALLTRRAAQLTRTALSEAEEAADRLRAEVYGEGRTEPESHGERRAP